MIENLCRESITQTLNRWSTKEACHSWLCILRSYSQTLQAFNVPKHNNRTRILFMHKIALCKLFLKFNKIFVYLVSGQVYVCVCYVCSCVHEIYVFRNAKDWWSIKNKQKKNNKLKLLKAGKWASLQSLKEPLKLVPCCHSGNEHSSKDAT